MAESVADRVVQVVVDVLKVDRSKITTDSRFAVDLGAKSIQSVELVAAFDEEFDIVMPEDEALSVQTVGDAIAYIESFIREKQGE